MSANARYILIQGCVSNNYRVFRRGRLYGAVLGGANTKEENFITQFGFFNSVLQKRIEQTLQKALQDQKRRERRPNHPGSSVASETERM
ncbi:hypothetical protein [Actinocorallia libanotica]